MKNRLNSEIIDCIKKRFSEGEQIVPFLTDLLFLGKEAVYRRLRGDVAFTIEEIAAISTRLGFSVDKVAGLKQSERVFFEVGLYNSLSPEETYYNTIHDYVRFFSELGKAKDVSGSFVKNYIPYIFSIYYESISKFIYFKWMRQRMGIDAGLKMADFKMPQNLLNLFKAWGSIYNKQKMDIVYIFDNNLFVNICRDIDFFYKGGFINDDELKSLQDELSDMVNYTEKESHTGISRSGGSVQFYLLPFDLESNYMYFEFDGNTTGFVHIYTINHLLSYDAHVCNLQKDWIDQLKRYSAFITKSGEITRLAYFKRQREHISGIGK